VIRDEGLCDSHDPTRFRKWERIVQELRMVTERAVHKKWTAVETARELDSRIDRILEKRRWMLAREAGDAS
jgi:multiple sugar transport system substrate-binding protein